MPESQHQLSWERAWMANLASLVKAVAQVVGGGKPVLAQGDGKDVKFGEALQIVPGLVVEYPG